LSACHNFSVGSNIPPLRLLGSFPASCLAVRGCCWHRVKQHRRGFAESLPFLLPNERMWTWKVRPRPQVGRLQHRDPICTLSSAPHLPRNLNHSLNLGFRRAQICPPPPANLGKVGWLGVARWAQGGPDPSQSPTAVTPPGREPRWQGSANCRSLKLHMSPLLLPCQHFRS